MPRYHVSHLEYDELCDLPTMTYFRLYAANYIHAAYSRGRNVYLMYINLKNFSQFNERYGFEEGDKLLTLTSLAIRAAFPGFLVSRVSEDHFLIVCESFDVEGSILDVCEQVHAYGRNANVELKVGILLVEDEHMSIGLACDYAKIACNSIAHRYDRSLRWYDDELAQTIEQRHYVESNIDRAIERGWIEVYFQPIVRSITGRVCEFEALARWNDPRYGLLSPGLFISVLEEARLIHKFDECVVRLVCKCWRDLVSKGPWRMPVSINLSRYDFELTDAFEMVDRYARMYDVPRQMLHVEITESALNDNANLLAREIERFRNAGYQVWIDDFGSGYSSLNTLKDYVFDVLKIDMVFLREFDTKPKSRAIISSMVNMAKQLGMQTLIEGVETIEQYEFVRGIGCEFVQGYLIGRPLPTEDNTERILKGELEIEHVSLHGYYDKVGRINSLSATPFDFPWEVPASERLYAEMLPLAIIEREHGQIRFMSVNEAFVDVINEMNLGSMAQVAEGLNSGKRAQDRIVRDAIEAAIDTDKIESVDVVESGTHCVLRVRHIASHEGVDALLVSFINLARFSDTSGDKLLQIALRSLYVMHDEVNIVDLEGGTVSTLYRGNSWLPVVKDDATVADAVDVLIREVVHPDDAERLRKFMDCSTIDVRVSNTKRGYLADAFRLLRPDGAYGWATISLVPLLLDGARAVLMCFRESNLEVCSTVVNDNTVSKGILWDALIDLIPAGVFWKDEDRRFLGVNRQFLDFYEFSSVNDVLGKNDEDMGWHVDEDPFKNNEFRVLRGDSILNAPGTCLARGEVRNISASKVPLWRNGEVVGLLGYFVDLASTGIEARGLTYDGLENLTEVDRLTGIPSLRGLMSSAVSYEEAFVEKGRRYVAITLDIRDMGGLNEIYGRAFGNRTIKTIARTLASLSGVSGVVARVGGVRFAALYQVADEEGARHKAEEMKRVVEGVHEVDGIRVALHASLGWAINTEAENLDALLLLAEQRMEREREA